MVRDESGAFFFFFFLLACKVFSKDETNEERERKRERGNLEETALKRSRTVGNDDFSFHET